VTRNPSTGGKEGERKKRLGGTGGVWDGGEIGSGKKELDGGNGVKESEKKKKTLLGNIKVHKTVRGEGEFVMFCQSERMSGQRCHCFGFKGGVLVVVRVRVWYSAIKKKYTGRGKGACQKRSTKNWVGRQTLFSEK